MLSSIYPGFGTIESSDSATAVVDSTASTGIADIDASSLSIADKRYADLKATIIHDSKGFDEIAKRRLCVQYLTTFLEYQFEDVKDCDKSETWLKIDQLIRITVVERAITDFPDMFGVFKTTSSDEKDTKECSNILSKFLKNVFLFMSKQEAFIVKFLKRQELTKMDTHPLESIYGEVMSLCSEKSIDVYLSFIGYVKD